MNISKIYNIQHGTNTYIIDYTMKNSAIQEVISYMDMHCKFVFLEILNCSIIITCHFSLCFCFDVIVNVA